MAKKKQLTEIICVLDKSSSMGIVKSDTIGGFNSFIEKQKALPDAANFTLTLFDTKYDIIYKGENIKNIKELTEETYCPGGLTALLDAIGKTIDEVTEQQTKLKKKDRPTQTIMVIITDGEENSSKEYTHSQIIDKIKTKKENNNWEFIFLGADETAIKESSRIGLSANSTRGFKAETRVGTQCMYRDFDNAVTSYRSSGSVDFGDKLNNG